MLSTEFDCNQPNLTTHGWKWTIGHCINALLGLISTHSWQSLVMSASAVPASIMGTAKMQDGDAIASHHQPPCRGCGVKHVVRNIFCPQMPQRLSWWENPLWKQSRWECMLRCSSTPVVSFSRDDIKQVVLSVRHHSSLCVLQFLLLAFSPRAFSCYSANTLPLLCPMSVWRPCQIKLKLFGDFPQTPGVLQRSAAPERQQKKKKQVSALWDCERRN